MVVVELLAKNTMDTPLGSVAIGETNLQSGMSLKDTGGISGVGAGASSTFTIGIDFNDTQQPAKFNIWWVCVIWSCDNHVIISCVMIVMSLCSVANMKKYSVQIEPVVGELLRPIYLSEPEFLALQSEWVGSDSWWSFYLLTHSPSCTLTPCTLTPPIMWSPLHLYFELSILEP